MFTVTCIAPVNIALIKYWGKRDEELILPINDSLSMTLSTDEMCAKTTVTASKGFEKNVMILNNEEIPFEENPRLMRCLKEIQHLALAKGQDKIPLTWKLRIASHNNFPTAAGLASSAAGYACLVYALACLYGVEDHELTAIARQGSGSACRSLHGGFVQWQMGCDKRGTDSIARQVAPASHWPEMHVLILVVSDGRKKTGSTLGMRRSVLTSDLIKYRASIVVPQRIASLTEAIKNRDFSKFAEITMKDSNQFHAIALDTYPPCTYMNDTSHKIVEFIHAYNDAVGSDGELKVAYTFDAGPNACLYVLEQHVPALYKALMKSFPNTLANDVEYLKGIPIEQQNAEKQESFLNGNMESLPEYQQNLLKYIIHTKVGTGPKRLSDED